MIRMDYWRSRELCDQSLHYARARRELAEARRARRRRLRWVLGIPLALGLALGAYIVVNGDETGALTVGAVMLTAPFLATFDLLGEGRP